LKSPVPSSQFPGRMVWKLVTGNWKLSASVPCTLRVRLRACARRQTSVFCGRKKLPFAGYSIVKDRSGEKSLGTSRSLRDFSPGPPRFFSGRCSLADREKPNRSNHRASWGVWRPQRAQTPQAFAKPKLVENTGLEPVTSWLQTRRSPS
jgi:hypothetical protein